jgi:hypothetical protein
MSVALDQDCEAKLPSSDVAVRVRSQVGPAARLPKIRFGLFRPTLSYLVVFSTAMFLAGITFGFTPFSGVLCVGLSIPTSPGTKARLEWPLSKLVADITKGFLRLPRSELRYLCLLGRDRGFTFYSPRSLPS